MLRRIMLACAALSLLLLLWIILPAVKVVDFTLPASGTFGHTVYSPPYRFRAVRLEFPRRPYITLWSRFAPITDTSPPKQ